ncbi:MAG: tRNA (guanine(10)-N(2))-dimethyltransferase [Promethearchaeia archaeon]
MLEKELIKEKEGEIEFYFPKADKNIIPSKAMAVFYNKKMIINRDIIIIAILAYNELYKPDKISIIDTMAATGVGAIRLLKHCKNIEKFYINDINPYAIELIRKNLELNGFNPSSSNIIISRKDACFLLTEIAQQAFLNNDNNIKADIISIDPFGTPNIYLDATFKAIKNRNGLLAITATDTAVLFGVRKNACIRKYLSKPLHTEYCKEIGARILLHFISRIGNINKIGIIPLLTFYSNHFIRVFALTFKEKEKITKNFSNYGHIIHCFNCGHRDIISNNLLELNYKCTLCNKSEKVDFAGPLWIGPLHDENFLNTMIIINNQLNLPSKKRINKILSLNIEELNAPITYYNLHKLSKIIKISKIPKIDDTINKIRERGYNAYRTHFDFLSIKTNADIDVIKEVLKELS